MAVVALAGGKVKVSESGVELDTAGLLDALSRARVGKGGEPARRFGESEARGAVERIRQERRQLPLASVLWVDDHPLSNVYERRALASIGIFCDCFTTNAEGLAALGRVEYDLVISDYGRDGSTETGADLLRELRRSSVPVPFVYYTFGVTDSVRARAREQGASAVTELPDDLLATVLDLLGLEANSGA